MSMARQDRMAFARKQGWDLDLFNDYLNYQEKHEIRGKFTVEDWAAIRPDFNMNNCEQLNWFSTWMGWGFAFDIPEAHSFSIYCSRRDRAMESYHENYVIYDESFIAPGFIVFRDDLTQFFKIYPANNIGFPDYFITAKDTNVDQPDENIRRIVFMSNDRDSLYRTTRSLYRKICSEPFVTINADDGQNNVFLEQTPNGYNFVLERDVLGITEADPFTTVHVGDNNDSNNWKAIAEFYNNLGTIKTEDIDKAAVVKQLRAI